MSGKSGGTAGAHYDTKEEAEKEDKDSLLLKAYRHTGDAVSYFSKSVDCSSPTTDTLGRQCQFLLLNVLSVDRLLHCCNFLQPLCRQTKSVVA